MPWAAAPGFPGASATSASAASVQASACSRAPVPVTTQRVTAASTNCSRPGPSPTTPIGTPIVSSRKRT